MSKVACLSLALTMLVPAVASAQEASCEFDPELGVLTIVPLSNSSPTIKPFDDGRIDAPGNCPDEATLTTIETIVVTGGSSISIRGVFSPGRTPEADGVSEIEFIVDGADTIWYDVNPGQDVAFTAYGIDVGGDLDKDVTIKGAEFIKVLGSESPDRVDASRYLGVAALELRGYGGDDLLIGSPGNDRIFGSGVGASTGIEADDLRGGPGNDYINGGAGDDILRGGSGNDTFYMGPGNAYAGSDTIRGGSGIDKVDYSDRTVPIFASLNGLPDDGIEGENGLIDSTVENVSTGSAADVLVGSAAGNTLDGGGGDDEVYGGGGDDLLRGGDGLDLLVGDEGNDTLRGGAGNDSLDGGAGVDAFFGEDGSDSFINDDGVAETVNCGAGIFDDPEPSATDTFVACELI